MNNASAFSPQWTPDRKYAWLLAKLRKSFTDLATEVRLPMLGPNLTNGNYAVFGPDQQFALPQCYTLLITAKACTLGNCFCIQRAFRANDTNTVSHLREFDILECGLTKTTSVQVMSILEKVLLDIYAETKQGSQCRFARISWSELNSSTDSFRPFDENSPGRQELRDFSHALKLSAPTFLMNLPWTQSSWAVATVSPGVTTRFNLLVPQIGEIVEGGERLLDRNHMRNLFAKIGLSDQLGWYAEALSPELEPVSVFAIGVERLASWLFDYDDIRTSHSWTVHPSYNN